MSGERKVLTEEEYKKYVQPFYDFETEDGVMVLEKSKGTFSVQNKTIDVAVIAEIDFRRSAKLVFRLYNNDNDALTLFPAINIGSDNDSKFTFKAKEIEGNICRCTRKTNPPSLDIIWSPFVAKLGSVFTQLGNDATKLKSVTLHIFNFSDVQGLYCSKHIKSENGESQIITWAELLNDEWLVEFNSLPGNIDKYKKLKDNGGYQLTHVLNFSKADNSYFTVGEAKKLISFFDFFISFSKGNMCRSVCPIGYDENNSIVWTFWNHPDELWKRPMTWLHDQHIESLEELCPKMYKLWNTEYWNSSLKTIIYWYITVNNFDHNINANIILTYTALERISYEYFVNYKKLMTKNKFKDLKGPDILRELLTSLGISLLIPSSRESLNIHNPSFEDGPHALNLVRNSIVHPDNKNHGQYKDCIVYVHYLGLWYLELVILRLCDYNGAYVNRLNYNLPSNGKPEYVPWRKVEYAESN